MRIAICDDEEKSRVTIIGYLSPFLAENNHISYEIFESGESFLSAYKIRPFDIIFLDIEMRGASGVEVARTLRVTGSNAIIIFITSHLCYVSDSFRVGAFQFLVKPILKEDFDKDFSRALAQYKINHQLYSFRYKERTHAIKISKIDCIEGYKGHLKLHTGAEEYEFVGNLSKEEEKLSQYNFIRCHQGCLVNMNSIRQIRKNDLLLKNGKSVPISKYKKSEMMLRFNEFLARYSL